MFSLNHALFFFGGVLKILPYIVMMYSFLWLKKGGGAKIFVQRIPLRPMVCFHRGFRGSKGSCELHLTFFGMVKTVTLSRVVGDFQLGDEVRSRIESPGKYWNAEFRGIYGRDIYKHRAATFGKQIKKTPGEKPQELDYLSSKLFKSLLNLFTHLFFVVSVEVSWCISGQVWSPKSLAAEKPEGIVVKSQWPTPSPSHLAQGMSPWWSRCSGGKGWSQRNDFLPNKRFDM